MMSGCDALCPQIKREHIHRLILSACNAHCQNLFDYPPSPPSMYLLRGCATLWEFTSARSLSVFFCLTLCCVSVRVRNGTLFTYCSYKVNELYTYIFVWHTFGVRSHFPNHAQSTEKPQASLLFHSHTHTDTKQTKILLTSIFSIFACNNPYYLCIYACARPPFLHTQIRYKFSSCILSAWVWVVFHFFFSICCLRLCRVILLCEEINSIFCHASRSHSRLWLTPK